MYFLVSHYGKLPAACLHWFSPCSKCLYGLNIIAYFRYLHEGATTVRKPKEKPKVKVEIVNPELTCEKCHKTLANPNSLAVHRQLHYGLKPFKCDFCDTRFTQKCNMKRHLRTCKIAKEHEDSTSVAKVTPSSRTRGDLGSSAVGSEHSVRMGNALGGISEQPSSPVF